MELAATDVRDGPASVSWGLAELVSAWCWSLFAGVGARGMDIRFIILPDTPVGGGIAAFGPGLGGKDWDRERCLLPGLPVLYMSGSVPRGNIGGMEPAQYCPGGRQLADSLVLGMSECMVGWPFLVPEDAALLLGSCFGPSLDWLRLPAWLSALLR